MADFTMYEGGGGHTPASSKHSDKIAGIPKTALYIGGAIVIMLYIIVVKRGQASQAQQANVNTNTDPNQVSYPTNGVDVASQLQNNQAIITGQVNSSLASFQADMNSQYGTQLTQLSNQMQQLQAGMDSMHMASHPNPTTTVAPVTHPAPPVAPVKPTPASPSWLSVLTGGVKYATPRGGWDKNSVVDNLKSHGYSATWNDQKRIAGAMGIQNYSGTASQNMQMLHNLNAVGK